MGPMAAVTTQFSGLLHTLHNGRVIAQNRRRAYEAEVVAGRVADDEVAAYLMLVDALRTAKAEAAKEKARADRLAAEVARLRLDRIRSR
ncbi:MULTISPECIES: hypothetical protein [unclassified Aureimonas]|uniref:hypothetical protein n=1 Tax=unclassified Aureimonas TaxID=2615206 RepID=UPI0006F661E4|nr:MULTISPECIES: hypothetical protein [unclassified Aureimonas]KQT61200.1 hypothetical protein ASG62_24145 [Aureimonas sp. Leaf427]KQT62969.1 hypothetical protein ASG54_23090 [Aureimonas sp. Leaf460]